jgi:hypothetical protein
MNRFRLGRIVATEGALEACPNKLLNECMIRHMNGDWGVVPPEDAIQNTLAITNGDRIFSAYTIDPARGVSPGHGDNTLWVITEADRSVTTFLLPDEY